MIKKSLTRRDFIKLAGVTLGTSVLAACAPQVVTQIVQETQIVNQTSVVQETQLVNQVITATPLPTGTAAPVNLQVWWFIDVPDLTTAQWNNDPNDPVYKVENFWGGAARAAYLPFLANHPGVSMTITGHDWDANLRENQLLAIASGNVPDTTYGEMYVSEFTRLGVYGQVDPAKAALVADGSVKAAKFNNNYYGIPESTGCQALMINLDVLKKAGLDPSKLPATWDDLLTMCKAVQPKNPDPSGKWGSNAWFTYGPNVVNAPEMRILPWFNQNSAPLSDDNGYPSANTQAAVDSWVWFNQLMWTSTKNLIMSGVGESEALAGQLFGQGVIALKVGWSNDMTSVGVMGTNAVAIDLPLPPNGKAANVTCGNTMISPLKGGKNPDMAITSVEEIWTSEAADAWLPEYAGIWIPALKSLLNQYQTYDKLDGFKTDIAKAMVRGTMKQMITADVSPTCPWPKNGAQCWVDWCSAYNTIWSNNQNPTDIKKTLDTLQTTLLTDTGQS